MIDLNDDTIQLQNVAQNIEAEVLEKLGSTIVQLVEEDDVSRKKWLSNNAEWLKLASQIIETKNTPWENASNVKYPLLTTAAINFHARAYGALIQEPNLVNIRVYGEDPNNQKASKANRVSQYMSYNLVERMEDWTDGTDRGLFILAILGMIYKKSYFSTLRGTVASDLVSPKDLILNYQARNFTTARKTHRIWLTENQIEEYKRSGVFLKVDLPQAQMKTQDPEHDKILGMSASGSVSQDLDTPREIFETHWFWDLDGDGYKEPWIVTVDRDSKTVLRIVPRFEWEDIKWGEDGEIVKIEPDEQFTSFIFIPDPNSPLYGMGFGSLVGPLNLAINTNINQLIDAGTASNMTTGFLGRGLNIRGGVYRTKPGLWQSLQNTGDDLRTQILPLPSNEPSPTLYNLLVFLVQAGEKLASIHDSMIGENPGQNQPYQTTAAVLEQGLQVFVGIYKRVFKSLGREYKKLYKLFGKNIDIQDYYIVLDTNVSAEILKDDFNFGLCDIRPVGDPNIVTDAQRLMRAQLLLQKLEMGMPINSQEVLKRVLEAERHPDIEALLQVEPKEPPIDMLKLQLESSKFEHQRQMDIVDKTLEQVRIGFEAMKDKAQALSLAVKAETTITNADAQINKQILDAVAQDEKNALEQLKIAADFIKQAKDIEIEKERMEHEKEVTRMTKNDKSNKQSKNTGSSDK